MTLQIEPERRSMLMEMADLSRFLRLGMERSQHEAIKELREWMRSARA